MSMVTWLKNGSSVAIDDRVATSNMEHSSCLSFNPLHTSDGGLYQCVVSTGEGGSIENVTFSYDLNVTSKYIVFVTVYAMIELKNRTHLYRNKQQFYK